MAGISNIYCIGGQGGFMGADGMNPIVAQIWQGYADRMWLEARYFDNRYGPIGRVKTVIPPGPDDPNMLIDAAIIFFPDFCKDCASFPELVEHIGNRERLDFHLDKTLSDVNSALSRLREDARSKFSTLFIMEGCLTEISRKKQQ